MRANCNANRLHQAKHTYLWNKQSCLTKYMTYKMELLYTLIFPLFFPFFRFIIRFSLQNFQTPKIQNSSR